MKRELNVNFCDTNVNFHLNMAMNLSIIKLFRKVPKMQVFTFWQIFHKFQTIFLKSDLFDESLTQEHWCQI